jgi:signal transduction histidine kinase
MPVEVTVTGTPARLPVETSAALYRIVQEALGNVFRHARASKAQVALGFDDGLIRLAIADDGIGIAEAEPGARVGLGMGNLRQRVEDLGGTLDVRSEPGVGTRIEVTVPVAAVGGDE